MQRIVRGAALAVGCLAGASALAADNRLSIGFREDAPPFVSRSEGKAWSLASGPSAEYEGFAAEICRLVLTAAEAEMPGDLDIHVFPVNAATRFEDENGKKRDFDMLCDTTSITRERLKACSFSFPYFVTGISFAAAEAGLRVSDVKEKRIGLVGGTTAVERLNLEWMRRFGENPEIKQFEDYASGIESLKNDGIEILFGDQILLEQANENASADFSVSNDILSTELYGICVNPNRPELLRIVNDTLSELYSSGQIYSLVTDHFEGRGASRMLVMLYAFYAVPQN